MRLSTLLICILLFSSCSKEDKTFTQAELEAKADSIFKAKLPLLKQQAEEDLNNRIRIELKPKIDSIRNISYDIPPPPQLRTEGLGEMPVPDTPNLKQ